MDLSALICNLLRIYVLVVFARILLEWIPVPSDHPVGRFRSLLGAAVDPLLRPIRRLVRPARIGMGAIDLSPLILIAAIWVLQSIVCG